MKVIGLTGSIGSGKSTIANMLRIAHVPVIDADELARRVTEANSPCLQQIINRFGKEILLADQSLDRSKLGRLVFNDPGALKDLEAIVHPAIEALRLKWLHDLEKDGHEVVVYMAPLIFEKNLQSLVDKTILVIAPESILIERMKNRDGLSEEEAKRRLALQMKDEEKIKRADEIIKNDKSLDYLFEQLRKVWKRICDVELPRN